MKFAVLLLLTSSIAVAMPVARLDPKSIQAEEGSPVAFVVNAGDAHGLQEAMSFASLAVGGVAGTLLVQDEGAVSAAGIKLPKIKVPHVEVPKVKIPPIKVPQVKVPHVKVPTVKPPRISFPHISWPHISWPHISWPHISLPSPRNVALWAKSTATRATAAVKRGGWPAIAGVVAVGGAVGGLVTWAGATTALGAIGFGAAGPIAGSLAAAAQVANVAAGSSFAIMQSVGMVGIPFLPFVAGGVVLTLVGWAIFSRG